VKIESEEISGPYPIPTNFRWIPLIAETTAGKGIEFTDMGYPVGGYDELVASTCQDKNAFAVKIEKFADSMLPSLKPGMRLIISPNTECVSGDASNQAVWRIDNSDESWANAISFLPMKESSDVF